MINLFLKKIVGTQNERELKKLDPLIQKINALEPEVSALSDDALKSKTDEFREHLKKKESLVAAEIAEFEERFKESTSNQEKDKIKNKLKILRNKIYEDILPQAFAVVREVAKRTVNMRHFDVQLLGGIVLHEGKIAEMATGEGKTLVATLPAYLNALTGKGVHIITVNDYLAKRDREWMGPIFEFLGLTVGVIYHDLGQGERKKAYACDITYGTNNEFGFDYLRDNMVVRPEDMVQRRLHYTVVDEVDSILIDEARTPLIISGPAEESTDKYYTIDRIVPRLKGRVITEKDEMDAKFKGLDIEKDVDFLINEKTHTANLTDQGVVKCEKALGVKNLYDDLQSEWEHHIRQALRAHHLYKKDVDYVVKNNEVIIVDEFTGRLMPGRRWSDGLHQAVEAKENVKIERENQTLATITFQNYFRMYDKLSGMTGTAETEAVEFHRIYALDVVVVPTNKPLKRTNHADVIYKTQREKFNAVCNEISTLNKEGRPVLVGTISIEKSEHLSDMLNRRNIPHHVLNAKYHEMEAEIVTKAGQPYAVTIATNMAGRGTDIVLGDGVAQKGGLHIVGTERHESRRIDNQLRGRAGRQGDPGSSRFYLSLEDDLLRIFGSEKIKFVMDRLGMEEGQDIQHVLISKSIQTAQKRVETYNFEIRKHLLEYDNVMNKQREVIYDERRMVLRGEDIKGYIFSVIEEVVDKYMDLCLDKRNAPEDWDIVGFEEFFSSRLFVKIDKDVVSKKARDEIRKYALDILRKTYENKEKVIGPENMRHMERMVLLQVMDSKWKDHLYAMDCLREGIGLRAYGQRDPLIEYQHEAFTMFTDMVERIKEDAIEYLFKVQAVQEEKLGVFNLIHKELEHGQRNAFREMPLKQKESLPKEPQEPTGPPIKQDTYKREEPKVGRNDPCPCGSGKKYKKCCGK
jgi:preprotein translocase subunit SecA